MNERTALALQISAGLAVVLCIYMMSLWIIQRDQLVADVNSLRQPKMQVRVMDGYAQGYSMADRSWSTINQDAASFVSMKRSFNRRGGAQFSYSFWMQVSDTSADNVANRTLVLRGDKTQYAWVLETSNNANMTGTSFVQKPFVDVLVKCPRIMFGPTYGTFAVELNTLTDPSARIDITSEQDPVHDGKLVPGYADPSMRHNALSLTQGKWTMYTFTFEDHVAISDFESGIMVRFYMNDALYQTSMMPGALRQNFGDLFLLPTISSSSAAPPPTAGTSSLREFIANENGPTAVFNGSMGNLSYFNYALSLGDVAELFSNGYPKYPNKEMNSGSASDPVYLSEYNRLDIYNT